jgi:hypothetical protein
VNTAESCKIIIYKKIDAPNSIESFCFHARLLTVGQTRMYPNEYIWGKKLKLSNTIFAHLRYLKTVKNIFSIEYIFWLGLLVGGQVPSMNPNK